MDGFPSPVQCRIRRHQFPLHGLCRGQVKTIRERMSRLEGQIDGENEQIVIGNEMDVLANDFLPLSTGETSRLARHAVLAELPQDRAGDFHANGRRRHNPARFHQDVIRRIF